MAGFLVRYLSPWPIWCCSLDGAVDRGSSDAEQFSYLGGGVHAALVKANEVSFLGLGELWLFPAQPAFGFCYRHSFPSSGPDEVGFELCNHAQDVEEQFGTAPGFVDSLT